MQGAEGIRYTFTRHVAEVTIGSNRASGHPLDEIDTICCGPIFVIEIIITLGTKHVIAKTILI